MTTELKAALLGAQWRHHADVTITLESGEQLQLVIRRPPPAFMLSVFEVAQKAGEVNEKREPTSEWNGLRLLARFTCACIFAPGAIRPLFSQMEVDDVVSAPWLLQLQEGVTSAISPASTLVEAAKGNSEATQT